MKPRYLLFMIVAFAAICILAAPPARRGNEKPRQKGSLIHLLHADELYFNQRINRDAQILVGHVRFRHDDVILTCDSALYYQQSNSFDAFGNVHMNQGDTLTLVSDVLFYDGSDQLARARYNVVLTHNKTRLYCDSLDYDRLYELGYFFNGGRMVDGDNTLESEEFNKLGEEASLGCVRLAVADAKWIYDNCAIGTQVHIYDSDKEEPLGKPDPIRIKDTDVHWDPTDDNEDNPYNKETPSIAVEKKTELEVGEKFDIFKGVSATDSCGNDITERLQYLGNVTTSRKGTYRVTYRVTDAMHRTAEKTLTIEVK